MAAQNPQLEMKLQNMPIPLRLDMVDETMGSVLEAAAVGDVHLVKSL
jgi:alcohol dehydrogenase